jgi:hypothetical protein
MNTVRDHPEEGAVRVHQQQMKRDLVHLEVSIYLKFDSIFCRSTPSDDTDRVVYGVHCAPGKTSEYEPFCVGRVDGRRICINMLAGSVRCHLEDQVALEDGQLVWLDRGVRAAKVAAFTRQMKVRIDNSYII